MVLQRTRCEPPLTRRLLQRPARLGSRHRPSSSLSGRTCRHQALALQRSHANVRPTGLLGRHRLHSERDATIDLQHSTHDGCVVCMQRHSASAAATCEAERTHVSAPPGQHTIRLERAQQNSQIAHHHNGRDKLDALTVDSRCDRTLSTALASADGVAAWQRLRFDSWRICQGLPARAG